MKRFTLAILYTFLGLSTAHAAPINPESCPSVNAIKAAAFFIQKDFTTSDGRNFYIATQEDQKYDTNWQDVWHFEIYDIEAFSTEDARQKLNDALPSLTFKEGPIQMGGLGWDCNYNISSGFGAQAYADLIDSSRHFISRRHSIK